MYIVQDIGSKFNKLSTLFWNPKEDSKPYGPVATIGVALGVIGPPINILPPPQ